MYIDRIYTKLYSNKDWNGLEQLVNEIKSFARKDYEGLGFIDRIKLRRMRNKIADELNEQRNHRNKRISEEESKGNSVGDYYAEVNRDLKDYAVSNAESNARRAERLVNGDDDKFKLNEILLNDYLPRRNDGGFLPAFKQELNQTINKIKSKPGKLWDKFIGNYGPK